MLTESETAIKKILIDELGKLSYPEKKHIEESTDNDFITKTYQEINKGLKWRKPFTIVFIIITIGVVFLSAFDMIYEGFLFAPIGVLGMFLEAIYRFEKRRIVYRILNEFK